MIEHGIAHPGDYQLLRVRQVFFPFFFSVIWLSQWLIIQLIIRISIGCPLDASCEIFRVGIFAKDSPPCLSALSTVGSIRRKRRETWADSLTASWHRTFSTCCDARVLPACPVENYRNVGPRFSNEGRTRFFPLINRENEKALIQYEISLEKASKKSNSQNASRIAIYG